MKQSANLRRRRTAAIGAIAAMAALALAACSSANPTPAATSTPLPIVGTREPGPAGPPPGAGPTTSAAPSQASRVELVLETTIGQYSLGFKGVGGPIDGQFNPTLRVPEGATVHITLRNGDGAIHDLTIPDFDVHTRHLDALGATDSLTFTAAKRGRFPYYCSVPGHRQAGMEGLLVVGEVEAEPTAPSIARKASDLPGPVGGRAPKGVQVDLETVETVGRLAGGTSYRYWTFNGLVPGPFLRVRVGDTVTVNLKNRQDSTESHSIDLHAATGPGGGATLSQVAPGESKSFTFKALNPGLYVYHCATPMVAHHIANGMYGLILVEPEGGLPPVDREFYVMQGEIYTRQGNGAKGHQEFSLDKLMGEEPEYFVLNGAAGSLTGEGSLTAGVGETVRIFFGVGGPNFTSSFHVIGEIFDRVHDQASLTAPPLTDVQSAPTPPGGATVVEFKVDVPGTYILVDHALSRLERGLAGHLVVEGAGNPNVYRPGSQEKDGGGK